MLEKKGILIVGIMIQEVHEVSVGEEVLKELRGVLGVAEGCKAEA